ncbi:ABC transporter permease [Kibdelosporangium phytohabitans]|uniref:ABC transporter permease n=1 Tax=Kibdelosporangium phytohabitans TaxID=860235 RepID=A0A0N9HSH5_9PSEU|nr:ABC transporter permease [Kibdelosporangium phytohabitans]ALG10188.1 ABC transporter permease [Kibdelosporangium phytohabitans]MBE1461200.1 peptide/nickel transport system permease protein [Kibdelosporangium phytohabitans]
MTSPAWARRRDAAGRAWREFAANRGGLVGLVVLVVFVLVGVLGPVFISDASLDVTRAVGQRLQPPSGEYWLGTDENGLSVLTLTLWGTRLSLVVGLAAALLSVVIGTAVGVLAGHFGGWLSAVLLRFTDFFLIMPSLVLAIALSAVLDGGSGTIILAIGVVSWPTSARLVRAQTLAVEARPYIERSRALGGGHGHVIFKHVLPSVLPLVFVNTTLAVGTAIVAESTLRFLGLGDTNEVTWGGLLRSAGSSGAITYGAWWYLLPPGIAIVLLVLAFTLVGRALESVLNPKLRERR